MNKQQNWHHNISAINPFVASSRFEMDGEVKDMVQRMDFISF